MNQNLTKQLCIKYPKLYKLMNTKPKKGEPMLAIMFGFECGDGWYELIDRLSEDIVQIDPTCEAVQVKEKFGGLRFYCGASKSEVFDRIAIAEQESTRICEDCGKPGKNQASSTGWWQTLCKSCRKDMEKRMKERMEQLRSK